MVYINAFFANWQTTLFLSLLYLPLTEKTLFQARQVGLKFLNIYEDGIGETFFNMKYAPALL